MNSEERMAILKMLAEDKITVDEAEQLLKALGGQEEAGPRRSERADRRRDRGERRAGQERRSSEELGEFVHEIGQEVRDAVRNVQGSEIGRIVNEEVTRAIGSIQRMDVGRVVGDIVGQLRDAVAEAVETGSHHEVDDLEWTLDGEGVERLQAETTSGKVEVRAVPGDRIVVRARRDVRARSDEGASAFAAQVAVHAERSGALVRAYAEYPKPPAGTSVDVSFEIECPPQLAAELRTVNGTVSCTGIDGEVQAQSVNGNVVLEECSGRVEARTRNGNARGRLGEVRREAVFTTTNGNVAVAVADLGATLTAATTNGNAEVALPPGVNGSLEAETTNGSVQSELEPSPVERRKHNQLYGRLGAGGDAAVRVRTQNGNVRVRLTSVGEAD